MSVESRPFGPEAPDHRDYLNILDEHGEPVRIHKNDIDKFLKEPDREYSWSDSAVVTFDRQEDEGEK